MKTLRVSSNNLKESTIQFIAALMFFLLIFMKVSPQIKGVCEIALIIMGTAVYFHYLMKMKNKMYRVFSIVLIIVVMYMMNILIVREGSIVELIKLIFVHFPIAVAVVFSESRNKCIWKSLFWMTAIFLLSRILFVDHYRIFDDTSSNMVSIYMIIVLFLLEYKRCENLKVVSSPQLVYYVTVLILSMLSQGRMGIIVSAVLFCISVYLKYFVSGSERVKNRIIKQVGILFGVCVAVTYVSLNMMELVNKYFPRFTSTNLYDTASSNAIRAEFLMDYFNGCKNPLNFIFGLDFATTSELARYEGGNVHNTFLMIHSYLGIFALLCVIIISIKCVMILKKNRQYSLLMIILLFFMRVTTDYCSPGNVGDVFILSMILICMKYKYERKNRCLKQEQ